MGKKTHVGPVAGADDQPTVEHELHVTGTTGLCPRRGDVFADVRGRTYDLTLADVVVWDEDDLQQVSHILVVIHHRTDTVDQMNDRLGHPVAWCRFPGKDRNA